MESKRGGAELVCPAHLFWAGDEPFCNGRPAWECTWGELMVLLWRYKDVNTRQAQFRIELGISYDRIHEEYKSKVNEIVQESIDRLVASEAEVEELRIKLGETQDD